MRGGVAPPFCQRRSMQHISLNPKKALASEAERMAVGTSWPRLMLRAVEPETKEEVAPVADSAR